MLERTLPGWLRQQAAGFVCSTLALGALTAVLAPLLGVDDILNVGLSFLLVALVSGAACGYAVGLFAALLADLMVNFFFVPPLHTFTVQEPRDVVGLMLFLAVSAVGASMLALLRREADLARAREAEASTLLELNQAIAVASSPQDALDALCVLVARSLNASGCSVLYESEGWTVAGGTPDEASKAPPSRDEQSLALEALRQGATVGRGGLGGRRLLSRRPNLNVQPQAFVPFPPEALHRGALRIVWPAGRDSTVGKRERLVAAFAAEASVSLQRAHLAVEAERADAYQRSDAFKRLLLSSVSHDLRSPLTAIKTAVANLRDPALSWNDADERAFLETVESQTDRLTATVSDLLQMSRLEAGVVQALIEPVQVTLLLRDAEQNGAHVTRDRVVRVEGDDSVWVAADYGLLMQALGNLIENSARYSRPDGSIRLLVAPEGARHVRIDVADEGPGIREEELAHVFEPYYRGPQSSRSNGSGLGLSIARAMVELCGGSLTAVSSPGGMSFSIELPAAEAP